MKLFGVDFEKLREIDDKDNSKHAIWAGVALLACIGCGIYCLVEFFIKLL